MQGIENDTGGVVPGERATTADLQAGQGLKHDANEMEGKGVTTPATMDGHKRGTPAPTSKGSTTEGQEGSGTAYKWRRMNAGTASVVLDDSQAELSNSCTVVSPSNALTSP